MGQPPVRGLVVDTASADDTAAIASLILAYPHHPITRHYGAAAGRVDAFLTARVMETLARPGVAVLAARAGGLLRGLIAVEALAFESGIFGLPMGGIPFVLAAAGGAERSVYDALLAAAERQARHMGMAHLSCRFRVDDAQLTHAMEAGGFFVADTTLEVGWNMDRTTVVEQAGAWHVTDSLGRTTRIPKLGVATRPVTEADIPAMRDLAREAFTRRTRTRYTVDPSLSPSAVGDLYAQWFERSCRGEFADFVTIATERDEPIGFETTKLDRPLSAGLGRQLALAGIAAVLPGKEARSAGAALHCSVLSWYAQNGVEFARGRILVENIGMLRGCLSVGAQVIAAFHTFHKSLAS